MRTQGFQHPASRREIASNIESGASVTIIILIFIVFSAIAIIQIAKANSVEKAMREIKGFNPSYVFSGTHGGAAVAIDTSGKKVCFMENSKSHKLFNYNEIVSVEVEKNGSSVTKVNRGSQVGRAALGGLLLGPVGLLVGGVTASRRNEEKIKSISLKVYTSSLSSPVKIIHFYKNHSGADLNAFPVKGALSNLDSWYGRFLAIID